MGTENMMQAVLAKVPAGLKISDLQTGFRILSRLPLNNWQPIKNCIPNMRW